MPRVATRHAHQLAYRQRFSVGVRMFGCLLFIAGGIVLVAVVVKAPDRSISDTPWLTVSVGFALAGCGAVLLCGERGKLIDREHRTVTRWWGVVRPLWHSSRDLQPYQAVVVESGEETGITRWHVSLFGGGAERLELFDLASHDVAQAVARQVAAFLSLTILLPGTAAAGALPAQTLAAPPPSERWIYWRGGRRPFRFLGVALLSLAAVFSLGVVSSAVSHDGRWLFWLAIAAPLFVLGLWLLCGGHKVEIDRQSVRVWRAWPLPPAVYDLATFYAIIIATTGEREPDTCLVGLIGPEQLRLELMGATPVEGARESAARLAATTNLPLIDESQPAVPSA